MTKNPSIDKVIRKGFCLNNFIALIIKVVGPPPIEEAASVSLMK
jgi:hypothetical protein